MIAAKYMTICEYHNTQGEIVRTTYVIHVHVAHVPQADRLVLS